MALEIVPDNPSDMELVLLSLKTLLEKIERMERTLAEYEPLLQEASRRLAGPLGFGRRK